MGICHFSWALFHTVNAYFFNTSTTKANQESKLNATDKIIAVSEKQIGYAEMLMEAQKKLVESGDARITDYILSINNYLFAKNTVTQNAINKFQIINQINYWNKK